MTEVKNTTNKEKQITKDENTTNKQKQNIKN